MGEEMVILAFSGNRAAAPARTLQFMPVFTGEDEALAGCGKSPLSTFSAQPLVLL